jgi:dipeptidyl aminopeptidase/acylaminoacyl peptidase
MIFVRCVVSLALVAWLASAAQKRPLEFRDIIELREPSQPRISPEGTRVAFLLSRASLESNSSQTSLWIVSQGAPARMLLDESAIGPIEWTPDGAALIARLSRPGKVAFWRVQLDGSAPTPLFEHNEPILSAWWSQDGSQLLYTSMEAASAEDRRRVEREGVVYDDRVHGIRSFTRGVWTKPSKPSLWLWRASSKRTDRVEVEMPRVGIINSVAWSPDGSMAAIEYSPATASAGFATHLGVLYFERGTGKPLRFEPLVTSSTVNRGVSWFPDSRSLAFAQTGDARPFSEYS